METIIRRIERCELARERDLVRCLTTIMEV